MGAVNPYSWSEAHLLVKFTIGGNWYKAFCHGMTQDDILEEIFNKFPDQLIMLENVFELTEEAYELYKEHIQTKASERYKQYFLYMEE